MLPALPCPASLGAFQAIRATIGQANDGKLDLVAAA